MFNVHFLIASKLIKTLSFLKYIQSIGLDEPCGIFVSNLHQ